MHKPASPYVSSETRKIIRTINPFGGGAQPSWAEAATLHGDGRFSASGCSSSRNQGGARASPWAGSPALGQFGHGALPVPFGTCPADPFTPPAIPSTYEALLATGKRVANGRPYAGGGVYAGLSAPWPPSAKPTPFTPASANVQVELAAALAAQVTAVASAASLIRKRGAEPGVERAPKNHAGAAQRPVPAPFRVAEQARAPRALKRPLPLGAGVEKKEPACPHNTEGVQGCRLCAASGLLSLFDAPSSSSRPVIDRNYVSPLAAPPAFDVRAPDSPPSKTARTHSSQAPASAYALVLCASKGGAIAA